MDLEFPDGDAVIFQGIAFVPLADGRLGEGKCVAVPGHIPGEVRWEDLVFVAVLLLIDPEQIVGIQQMLHIDGHHIPDAGENHFLKYIAGHFGRVGQMLKIQVTGFRTGLANLGRTDHFAGIGL